MLYLTCFIFLRMQTSVGRRWLGCCNKICRQRKILVPRAFNNSSNPIIIISFCKYYKLICRSIIDQFFGGTFKVEWKCTEAEDETATETKEQFLQLSCFISQDVRYMHSGLRSVSLEFNLSYCFVTINFCRKCKSKLQNYRQRYNVMQYTRKQ